MTPILTFDLETVPDVDGLRRLRPEWAALTDAEVAERAFAERREKTGSDFLPHHLHRIVAVGCAFRDDSGFRVRCLGGPEDGEARLITDFFRLIDRYGPQLVSWNGGGFDLPVLHYRGLIHGVAAHRYWDLGEDDRETKFNNYVNRYHLRHIDLMDVLSHFQARASAPLDDLARLAGYPGKTSMMGAQVWDAFRDGGIERIRAYCECDVVNTFLLHCSWRRMRGHLEAAAFEAEMQCVRASLQAAGAPHWQEFLAAWTAAGGPAL